MWYTQKKIVQFAIIGLICGIGLYLLTIYLTSNDFRMIKLLFSSFFTVFIFSYLVSLKTECKRIVSQQELLLVVIILVVNIPLLTQGYHYYDDLWAFPGIMNRYIILGIGMMRPFHGLLMDMFYFATPENANIPKIFSVAFLILFALLLFSWIKNKSGSALWAFTLCAAVCISSSMSDHVGYSATISLLPGLTSATLSVILYDKIYLNDKNDNKINTLYICLAFFCIVFSFMLYQIASPIVFFMIAIHLYYSNYKKKLKNMFTYLLTYGCLFAAGAITYYVANSVFTNRYGIVAQQARGSFISLADIVDKLKYFGVIARTATLRFVASMVGDSIFNTRRLIGVFVGTTSFITNAIIVVATILIVIAFLSHYIKNRNIPQLVFLFICIPASYFPLLILRESGYFTYYAIPLIALLAFYIVCGFKEALLFLSGMCKKIINEEKLLGAVAAIFIAVLAVQNVFYIQNIWVIPNVVGYEFVKRSIQTKVPGITGVHVVGVITPGQASIYSDFAVRLSLHELGFERDSLHITHSDTPYFSTSVFSDSFARLRIAAETEEELRSLESSYAYNESYDVYFYNHTATEAEQHHLYELFKRSGLIPPDLTQVSLIDLQWTQTQLVK